MSQLLCEISPKHLISAWEFIGKLVPSKKDSDNFFTFEVLPEKNCLQISDDLNNLVIQVPILNKEQISLFDTIEDEELRPKCAFKLDARKLPKLGVTKSKVKGIESFSLFSDTILLENSTIFVPFQPVDKLYSISLIDVDIPKETVLDSNYLFSNLSKVINKFPDSLLQSDRNTIISYSQNMYVEYFPGLLYTSIGSDYLELPINIQLFKKLTSYFDEVIKLKDSLVFIEKTEDYLVKLNLKPKVTSKPKITTYLDSISKEKLNKVLVRDTKALFDDFKSCSALIDKKDNLVELLFIDSRVCFRPYNNKTLRGETVSVPISIIQGTDTFTNPMYLLADDLLKTLDIAKTFTEVSIEWENNQSVLIFSNPGKNRIALVPLMVV